MRYDCRPPGQRDPKAGRFPANVRIVDPRSGQSVPNVFWADTAGRLGRFVADAFGRPMLGPDGQSRLEVWEIRSWVAVAVDSNEVVARSEDFVGQISNLTVDLF